MTNVSGGAAQGGGESVRRLRRRADHRVLAGVAGGLADYLSVPAWLVRLGFVILAFTGAGILLYLIGWVLIPAQDESESIADRALQGAVDGPAWLGGLLLLIGALLIASRTHLINPAPRVGHRADRGRRVRVPPVGAPQDARGTAAGAAEPPLRTVAAPRRPAQRRSTPPAPDFPAAAAAATTTEELPPPPPPAPWTPARRPGRPRPRRRAPRPPRERSGLGWFVLGLALAVAGAAGHARPGGRDLAATRPVHGPDPGDPRGRDAGGRVDRPRPAGWRSPRSCCCPSSSPRA